MLFGFSGNRSKEKRIEVKLPQYFRKDVLLEQLPYLAYLKNPAIADFVKNGILFDLSLQKYLLTLVTGVLKDIIQDSLDMIVSNDGKWSDALVIGQLVTKFPSALRKANCIDPVFKDKAKFET